MICFAEYSLDPATGELFRGGRRIALEHQPSLVLSQLVMAGGALVSRRDLAAALWGDATHVNFDDGLNYCIRQVRAALGDDPRSPRFIETVPRRGYRFIAPVWDAPAASLTPRRRLAPAIAVAALVLAAVVLESRPNNHHEVAVSIARTLHDLIF
jgi:DNA-binding winged helix-turn-helix (wHTH) protein